MQPRVFLDTTALLKAFEAKRAVDNVLNVAHKLKGQSWGW